MAVFGYYLGGSNDGYVLMVWYLLVWFICLSIFYNENFQVYRKLESEEWFVAFANKFVKVNT